MSDFLANLFPDESEIPAPYKMPLLEQREYLIGGKLKTWDGDLNPVLSPVCTGSSDGLKQKLIGRTPLLTAQEALDALEAAVKAYDLGKGIWPMMPVITRIEYVEKFLVLMREKRTE